MRPAGPTAERALGLLGSFVGVSVVIGLLFAGLALPGAWATGNATRSSVEYFNSLPGDLAEPPLSEQSTVLNSAGQPVAHFYDEKRITIPLNKIAPIMRQAIVAIEDSRFYQHGGVDPKGLLRALAANTVNDGKVQGASTLTQQYIKLRILEEAVVSGDEAGQTAATAKNYGRKLQEVRLAVSLEKKKTKDEILRDYLNIANFGDSTYGVEAASQYFFNGTTAEKLTLPQAALLAGLVQAPATYNPFQHPDAAVQRRDVVLARMHELGAISDADYAAARTAPLGVKAKPATSGCVTAFNAGYFCSYVRNVITKDPAFSALGKTPDERLTILKRGGLTIRTSLDSSLQEAARKALVAEVPIGDRSDAGAAAVTVEPGTGRILAMVQNKEFYPGDNPGQTEINFNADYTYGTSVGFQPGSSFKPFTLATWLAKGKGLYDVVDSAKRPHPWSEFEDCEGRLSSSSKPWDPSNSEPDEGGGPMTVMDATRFSVNTAYVDMSTKLSLCDIKNTAEKLGVHLAAAGNECDGKAPKTTKLPDCIPSMVLGALNIAPLTMAAAYAGFAADGMYCAPRAVDSITDRDGKNVPVPAKACSQAMDANVAHGVTYALKRVLVDGTASGLGIGRPAAGKTGTTDDSVDTWFVGYTPQRSTAVWVGGNPNPGANKTRPSLNNVRIGPNYPQRHVFGATIAAPVWHDIMIAATKDLPEEDWPNPTGKILSGESVVLPPVLGKTLDEAKSFLEEAGFSVTVGDPKPSPIPSDRVAEQSPAAGSRVAKKSKVTIYPGDGSGGVPGDGRPGIGGPGIGGPGNGGPGNGGPGNGGPGNGGPGNGGPGNGGPGIGIGNRIAIPPTKLPGTNVTVKTPTAAPTKRG